MHHEPVKTLLNGITSRRIATAGLTVNILEVDGRETGDGQGGDEHPEDHRLPLVLVAPAQGACVSDVVRRGHP